MPIYEYRCRRGHTFEVMQSMSDDHIAACTECHAPVDRVFRPIAVHFKGSGFYSTDYGRKRGGGGGDSTSSEEGKADKDGKAGKDDKAKKTDGKSESSISTKSDSSGGDS